jgi:hypothetical protein
VKSTHSTQNNTQTNVIVAVIWRVLVAMRGTTPNGIIVPRTAAQQAEVPTPWLFSGSEAQDSGLNLTGL